MILDFDRRFGTSDLGVLGPPGFAALAKARQYANSAIVVPELGDPEKPVGPPVFACVDAGAFPIYGYEGRWIAHCHAALPDEKECAGAEYVSFRQPIFMCCSCWNVTTGHQWRVVVVPAPELRGLIERALLARPGEFRTWGHHESVADLVAENVEHGFAEMADPE